MALHPFFQWGEPICRIPFEEESNRPLFTALFKHMQVRQLTSSETSTSQLALSPLKPIVEPALIEMSLL